MMMCSKEIFERLIINAKNYDNVTEFMDDIGWDGDWMPDLMEDPDSEEISIYDNIAINDVLVSAFEKAHNVRFIGGYRWGLLNS